MEIVTPPANGTIGSISDDEKVIYTPNKDFKGTDTFTYTAEDNESTGETGDGDDQRRPAARGGGAADRTAPEDLRHRGLAEELAPRLEGLASISKAPIGTTISFRLSEAGRGDAQLPAPGPSQEGGKPAS